MAQVRTHLIEPADWRGVLPVPPLARRRDGKRSIDFDENTRLVRHMSEGGIRMLLYGGNAFLYHVTVGEYEQLLEWLNSLGPEMLAIPSAGPSYGRAIDQASLLRQYSFPCVMLLPCADPRDAAGLERGYREFADAAATKLIVYLKEESNLGADKDAGLDAVARLIDDGICVGVKYAVIRANPSEDGYLDRLLSRVDRKWVISGIGERPAIAHMRDFGLSGFTTGSGCLAPRLSNELHRHCAAGEWTQAAAVRDLFIAHEDLRDTWGPARVLHASTELAGVAVTGPIAPYVSELNATQQNQLRPVASALVEANASTHAVVGR